MTQSVRKILQQVTRVISKLNSFVSSSFGKKYLLYTNVGLSITLSGVGDIIEQHYEILFNDSENWDRVRTRNMSAYGMITGVFCHHWYIFLDRLLPSYTIRAVIKKIVLDQLICSPVCITTLFVSSGLLEGKSPVEMLVEVKQKAWKLYVAEWAVWPLAQFVNFYFLPTRFRVLYDNTISLGYDVYTSYVKYEDGNCENS